MYAENVVPCPHYETPCKNATVAPGERHAEQQEYAEMYEWKRDQNEAENCKICREEKKTRSYLLVSVFVDCIRWKENVAHAQNKKIIIN